MISSPYKGIKPTPEDTVKMYQVLKFYYQDIDTLAMGAVAEIMKTEFECDCGEFDVFLYLHTLQMRDLDGNLILNEIQ